MVDNIDYNGPLPPGWEQRYDIKAKRNYYIDNYNRTTTWDDPRPRYRALLMQQSRQGSPSHSSVGTGDMIPLQSSYPPPPQPAFQLPPTPFSQLAPSSYLYQEFGSGRPSPVLGRVVGTVMGANAFQQRAQHPVETSFSSNTDEMVAKINATFPTASETHIRMLLKKYLKNTFPKADETLLLDVLASEENNVMKATEKLKVMGFEKRITPPPPPRHSTAGTDDDDISRKDADRDKIDDIRPAPPPRMKSLEEKAKMKSRLEGLYSDIPERLIQIAIESAEFDEEKARQILMLMVHEEKENQPVTESGVVVGAAGDDLTDDGKAELKVEASTSSEKKPSPRIAPTNEGEDIQIKGKEKVSKWKTCKISRGTSTTEDKEFRSPLVQKADGRNSSLRKGPNDQLLLVDYVTWHGPNSELRSGKAGTLAKGPNKANLGEKCFLAKGPNKDLWKGAALGLAKGSIYSQLSGKTESRGQ